MAFRLAATSLVLLAAASLGAGALAQEAAHWIGVAPSHRSVEHFEMSVGVTASQQPRRAVRFDEVREVLNVPGHYGPLFAITGDGQTSVLWFRDADGSVRNAVVTDAATRFLKIQSVPTGRYEFELREEK